LIGLLAILSVALLGGCTSGSLIIDEAGDDDVADDDVADDDVADDDVADDDVADDDDASDDDTSDDDTTTDPCEAFDGSYAGIASLDLGYWVEEFPCTAEVLDCVVEGVIDAEIFYTPVDLVIDGYVEEDGEANGVLEADLGEYGYYTFDWRGEQAGDDLTGAFLIETGYWDIPGEFLMTR